MKTILHLLLGLAFCGSAMAQTKTVTKTVSGNDLTESLNVPSGKTLTIESGATINAAAGSTITGFGSGSGLTNFASTLTGGTLTFAGTLTTGRTLTWRDLAGTVALTSDLSAYLTTADATTGYQPLDQMLTDIAALTDPGGDRLLFWDDSEGELTFLQLGTNLSITASTLNASGGGITALTGDVTASGSGSVAATLANTAVTPGNYYPANITVDAKGRITAATSMSTTGPGALAVMLSDYAMAGSRFGYEFTYVDDPYGTPVETTARLLSSLGTDMREILLPSTGGTLALTSQLPTTSLTLTGGTVTAPTPLLSMSQTWNDAADTMRGIELDVTNTASASTSTLMRLNVGGSPVMQVGRGGVITAAEFNANGPWLGAANSSYGVFKVSDTGFYIESNAYNVARVNFTHGLCLYPSVRFGFGASSVEDMDTGLNRASAGVLKVNNGSSGYGSIEAASFKQSTGPTWTSGSGSPEGVETATPGSLYSRTSGGAGTTLYVKESGSGNTGWVAK